MYAHVQTLRHNRTTSAARLACVARVDGDQLATSVCDFVAEHLPERAQRRAAVDAGDERNAAELRQRIYETSAQLWQARRNCAAWQWSSSSTTPDRRGRTQ